MRASRRFLPRQFARIFVCALFAWAAGARATDAQSAGQLPPTWDDSVHALAEDIVAAVSPARTVSLDVRNISSLAPSDAAVIRHELESELARRGIHFGPLSATEVRVEVTLSESADTYVWIAEIAAGESKQVAMADGVRSPDVARLARSSMTLQRNLLWVQPEAMLDFASRSMLGGIQARAIALEPKSVDSYDISPGGTLDPVGSAPISRIQPSRDLRGQLTTNPAGQMEAHIGKTLCQSDVNFPVGLSCGDEVAGGWRFPDGSRSPYVAGRNFFKGFPVAPDGPVTGSPFYSAATNDATDVGYSRILTEPDGKARLYENSKNPSAAWEGWGDDIATIRTGCDAAWQVLVTGTGDWTQPDRIEMYEIRDHQGMAVGQALGFPGPILALWPAEDAKSARVVSRNLQTGMYEASIVSVTCGN